MNAPTSLPPIWGLPYITRWWSRRPPPLSVLPIRNFDLRAWPEQGSCGTCVLHSPLFLESDRGTGTGKEMGAHTQQHFAARVLLNREGFVRPIPTHSIRASRATCRRLKAPESGMTSLHHRSSLNGKRKAAHWVPRTGAGDRGGRADRAAGASSLNLYAV